MPNFIIFLIYSIRFRTEIFGNDEETSELTKISTFFINIIIFALLVKVGKISTNR